MKKLKPCPFCGGKAVVKRKTFTRVMDPLDPEGTLNVKQKNVYVVGCTTPDCILYCNEEKNTARLLFTSGSRKGIEERWNTRPEEGHAED